MAKGLKEFEVHGPFVVPLDVHNKVAKKLTSFWKGVNEEAGFLLSECRGVYVFAMRAAGGYTPIYVGKAGDTIFKTEAFAHHKRSDHYNPAIRRYKKGTPVLFLVMHPCTPGRPNLDIIDGVEGALIAYAWEKNKDLSNVRRLPKKSWSIKGVLLAARGQPTKSAQQFRKALGI